MTTNKTNKCIVRAKGAGVFYASVADKRIAGGLVEVDLVDARRIHRWRGATECIGIALHGVGKQSSITEAVPSMTVTSEMMEFIPCSEEAVKCLDAHPAWKV